MKSDEYAKFMRETSGDHSFEDEEPAKIIRIYSNEEYIRKRNAGRKKRKQDRKYAPQIIKETFEEIIDSTIKMSPEIEEDNSCVLTTYYDKQFDQSLVYYQFHNDMIDITNMKDKYILLFWREHDGVEYFSPLTSINCEQLGSLNIETEDKLMVQLLHYCVYLVRHLNQQYMKTSKTSELVTQSKLMMVSMKKHMIFGKNQNDDLFGGRTKYDFIQNLFTWSACYMTEDIIGVLLIVVEVSLLSVKRGSYFFILLFLIKKMKIVVILEDVFLSVCVW